MAKFMTFKTNDRGGFILINLDNVSDIHPFYRPSISDYYGTEVLMINSDIEYWICEEFDTVVKRIMEEQNNDIL